LKNNRLFSNSFESQDLDKIVQALTRTDKMNLKSIK